MSERETTPDITSELNALADQVQQDREAGVFLGKGVVPSDKIAQIGGTRENPGVIVRTDPHWRADCAIIALARNNLTPLLDLVERLDRELCEVKRSLKHEQAARIARE